MRKCAIIFIALLFAASLAGCVTAATSATATAAYSENVASATSVSIFSGEAGNDSLFFLAPTPTPDAPPVDMPAAAAVTVMETDATSMATASPAITAPAEIAAPEKTAAPTGTPAQTEAPATPAPSATPEFEVHDLEDVKGYVAAGTVNMRKGPGTDYELIAEYERGDPLYITAESGDWYRVKIDGTRGYMLKKYVGEGSAPTATPKATPKPTAKPTEPPAATEPPIATEQPVVTEQPIQTPNASISTGSSGYTSDELYLLAQLVYKEGDGASYYAVACVIDNRIKSSKFPNSVHGVVYQSGQFSTSGLKKPSSSAISAVTTVFVDGNNTLPSGVLYFRNSSGWSGHELYEQIGGNYFYY